MAGTPHGIVDCYSNAANNALNQQELFKAIYDFFAGSARHTIVARYNGDVAGNIPLGGGRGTDYHNGTNPFGRNAWFIVEFTNAAFVFYVFFQFQDGSSETVQGGTFDSLATTGSGACVGVQVAAGKTAGGASANPWAGSLLNNGADTKATAWWAAPGGGRVYVMPRACSAGGGYSTNKNNIARISVNLGTSPTRYHVVADDDTFAVMQDADDNGGYAIAVGGLYTPRAGLANDVPLFLIADSSYSSNGIALRSASIGFIHGLAAVGAQAYNGGIRGTDNLVGASGSIDVHPIVMDLPAFVLTGANMQPNRAFSPAAYDEWPFMLGAEEGTSAYGYLGELSFVRAVIGPGNKDHKTDFSRAYFGTSSPSVIKLSIPWNGVSAPGTAVNRAGVTF
jgi:hypothetical protein